MERNNQKVGLINWVILLVATIASVLVTRYVNSTAGLLGSVLVGIGFLVAIVSYFQMRLEERERLEKLEFDELNKAKNSAALFTTAEDTFAAQRSREQFERFFIPGFTILLFLLQCAAIFWEWKYLDKSAAPLVADRAAIAMSLFGLLALILFILGKYSAGLARLDGQRLLRPVAGYLLLSAYVNFILAANLAAVQAGFPKSDIYVARGLAVILGLVAIETLLSLILEIYRPRVKGKVAHLLYESRLVGLFGQPEGIFKTAAHALDYQFGFKVSETWFYRFLQKALAWLLIAQIAVLIISTTFVFIETGEQGLLERFGKPVAGREVLNPGFHFKMPSPIDKVHRFRTEQIQNFNIGIVPDKDRENEKTVLWTVSHYKEEFNLLVASREPAATVSTNTASGKKSPPVNLLSVSIPVQFQITNLTAWAYNNESPGELLEKLATREVVRYLVSVDLFEIMSSSRAVAAQVLRERIQSVADQRELGAKIVFVGLQDIHPPVSVAAEYEKVLGAIQSREAKILEAKAYQIQTNAIASAEAFRTLRTAESYKQQREVTALAQGAAFTNKIPAFKASPTVYSQRAYLQTLARSSAGARKYVIATTNTSDVITYNLEDKIRTDLLDIAVPPAKK